jgi:hypothetical protein
MSGVGVQIMTIYINSTGPAGSGCSSPNPDPCILNPSTTIASYAFNKANQFLNPGEVNHAVLFALPISVILPDPTPAFPQNSILIATSRGNVFAFQWPNPLQIFGQSGSAFSSGIMKVAYTGTLDSKNEPGPVAGGSGGTTGTGYCHSETSKPYPAAAGYAEKLTGITSYGDGGVLWFVNPWVTGGSSGVLQSVVNNATQMYLYVIVINTGKVAYTPTAGSIDLTWYSANHLDGTLIGVYYNGNFYPACSSISSCSTAESITPTTSYYAIYHITTTKLSNTPWSLPSSDNLGSIMFWGDASITDWWTSTAESSGYYSATILLPGVWIRSGC